MLLIGVCIKCFLIIAETESKKAAQPSKTAVNGDAKKAAKGASKGKNAGRNYYDNIVFSKMRNGVTDINI